MKTISNITITLAIAVLCSCQVLKKEKLSSKMQIEKQLLQIEKQRNQLDKKSKLHIIDSSQNDFTMLLWPKGKFTYSLAKGFAGEADKILIKDRQKKQKSLDYNNHVKQDSASLNTNYNNQKETSLITTKHKISLGYNLGWVLVLLLIFALIWAYRKVKA